MRESDSDQIVSTTNIHGDQKLELVEIALAELPRRVQEAFEMHPFQAFGIEIMRIDGNYCLKT